MQSGWVALAAGRGFSLDVVAGGGGPGGKGGGKDVGFSYWVTLVSGFQ